MIIITQITYFLQIVSNSFSLWTLESAALEELNDMLSWALINNLTL